MINTGRLLTHEKAYIYWLISHFANTILLISIFFILRFDNVYAQNNEISYNEYGFTLTVPNNYEYLKSPSPTVPVIIKAQNSSYPEFNIVVETEKSSAPVEISKNDWAKKVKEEYALVGITKIEVEKSYNRTLPLNVEMVTVEITYQLGDDELSSIVGRIRTTNNDLIITYKDNSNIFESRRDEFDKIIAGLKVLQPLPTTKDESSILSFLGPIVLLILAWKLSRKKRTPKTSAHSKSS